MTIGRVRLTYLHVLVGGLLVLLGHGSWRATSEAAGCDEDGERGEDAVHGQTEDLPVLARWGKGTWAVRAESHPVGWDRS